MTSEREHLLRTILSQPSAPFRERHVVAAIRAALDAGRVPYFLDRPGNLVVGAASEKEYRALLAKKAPEPLRLFIAHMDHPGFHAVKRVGPAEIEVKWHGGSPTQHLEGAKVWLAGPQGWLGDGSLARPVLLASGRALDHATVKIETLRATAPEDDATGDLSEIFGGFAFREPVWREGELLYTKAADDLVGAFAIVSLALDLFGKGKRGKPPFLGLLTRAEEVGFIGAIAHLELGHLARAKRRVICVSIETSRQLPGAEIGKGPVVRLGDKYTVFDAGALRVFSDLAARALPNGHQRRVMDGGTCEATAATVFGLPAIGISVPLGNYHNQSFEGGPDSRGELGPAPEFVHLGDVAGLLELCRALLQPRLAWGDPWSAKRKELRQSLRKYRPLLRS